MRNVDSYTNLLGDGRGGFLKGVVVGADPLVGLQAGRQEGLGASITGHHGSLRKQNWLAVIASNEP